jgi:branched-chain amino acid transport system ATP-binding protein
MKPILRLDHVCKNFGGVVAAKDVTISVQPGTIHGLIGPNGAGKTTMMNIISGIYQPDSGRIYFDERDITDVPDYRRARMGIGRTFQTPRFLQRSSIRENLLLGTDLANQMGYVNSFFGKKGVNFEEELQELVEVARIPFNWDDDISALPFGKRKLLEIVRTMLSHPKVMLVDEPAAGLNTREIEDAMNLLNLATCKHNIGVLLIEHFMDMIMDICSEIIVLSFGEMIAIGTPEAISTNPKVIEAYLGGDDNA